VQILARLGIAAAALAAIVGSQAAAQTPEEFYRGKSIDFVIGYPPGGSNDTFGRLVARHLGKYIPGHPSIVPKNTPGAGSFLAVNQIFNIAPKDGTVLGIIAHRLSGSKARLLVSDHSVLSNHYHARKHGILRQTIRTFYPFADARIAVSTGAARDVAQLSGLPISSFTVVPNPIAFPARSKD